MFNELNKPYVFHLVSAAIQRYQLFLDPYISLTYSIQNVNAVMESSKAFSDWIVLFKVNMCGFLSSQELQWNPSALRSASVCFNI